MNNVPEASSTHTSDDLSMYIVALSMHCGHCPKCGHLGPADTFFIRADEGETVLLSYRDKKSADARYECPKCEFSMTAEDVSLLLKGVRSFLKPAVDLIDWQRQGTNRLS